MSPLRRKQAGLTGLLMLLGALAELFTVGAVLPLLALLSRGDIPDFPGSSLMTGFLGEGDAPSRLSRAALLLAGSASVAALLRLVTLRESHRFVFTFCHELAARVFQRILRQPYALFVSRNQSAVFASMDKFQLLIHSILVPLMQGLISAIIAIAIALLLLFIAPGATLTAGLTLMLLYGAATAMTGKRLAANSVVAAQMSTERIRALREALGALRDIIIDGSQEVFERRFVQADAAQRRAQAENAVIAAAPRFLIEASGIIIIAFLTIYMSLQPGGLMSALPILGALAFGAQRLLPLINSAYAGWTQARGNIQVLRDLLDLLETPVEEGPGSLVQALPFERELVLEQASLDHVGRGAALSDVTITIPKGARIGISGRTGSGKSSLLDLLMGLVEPTKGEIRVDGTPLRHANRRAWRAQVAHVPQTVFLTDSSIAENIAFGAAEPDMERVHEAARKAQLTEFIERLPQGFATLVGDGGVQLSGGQRQRIAIARALYRNPKVLMLDEATGQLDPVTEASIMDALAAIGREMTIIIAGHRDGAFVGCDHIYFLEQGRLVAAKVADVSCGDGV